MPQRGQIAVTPSSKSPVSGCRPVHPVPNLAGREHPPAVEAARALAARQELAVPTTKAVDRIKIRATQLRLRATNRVEVRYVTQ